MAKQAAIFDIDGTLSDSTHREHFLRGESKDWAAFFEAGEHDDPNALIVEELKACIRSGREIVLMTGRPEKYRTMTLNWLENHGIAYHALLMRPDRCFDKSRDLKGRWLSEMAETHEFVVAYDDEHSNVAEFAEAGIPAYLVKDGKPVYKHGQAPKAGKSTGRKPREEKTKPVPVRLPLSTIDKYKIDGAWLKQAVEMRIAAIDAAAMPMCKHNNLAHAGKYGVCNVMPESYPIIPGDCPCDDFE